MTRAHLSVDAAPERPEAVALVLHGGRSRSEAPTRPNQLAVLRLRPFAHAVRRAGPTLAVARVRYRVRGWNGAEQSPVADVRWALDELRQRWGELPTALVGHSMGGRAAVYCAGEPGVRVVVGLAPWLEPGDPVAPMTGRRLLVAHGTGDRMTSADASAAFVRQATPVTRSAAFVSVHGDRHPMLRRAGTWHELAAGFTVAALTGGMAAEGTVDAATAKIVERALAGESPLSI